MRALTVLQNLLYHSSADNYSTAATLQLTCACHAVHQLANMSCDRAAPLLLASNRARARQAVDARIKPAAARDACTALLRPGDDLTLRESFQMLSILSMISMLRGSSLDMTLTGHFSSASGMTVWLVKARVCAAYTQRWSAGEHR